MINLNDPYYVGFRAVLREIDTKVSYWESASKDRADKYAAGQRDAWLRAQKVVHADVERMQTKEPPVASDLVKRKR